MQAETIIAQPTVVPKRKRSFVLLQVILLSVLLLMALTFIFQYATRYFRWDKATYDEFWNVRFALLSHILGGMTAILIGPFQFIRSFRNRHLTLHRTMGKVYLLSILMASIGAYIMVFTTAPGFTPSFAIALFFLASAWITTSGMAYRSIRLKRIQQHQQWMARSYIVTFAFVSFRFLDYSSFFKSTGTPGERATNAMWICWVVPLLVYEVLLNWNKEERPGRKAPMKATAVQQ